MTERRQATRREPIVVEVRGTDFTAEPLPWQKANDLGDEILRQNVEGANWMVSMYVKDDLPQLDMAMGRKISDWNALLTIAYPAVETATWNDLGLDVDESAELILAALDVNHLEHIKHLVDPNSPAPTTIGGSDTLEGLLTENGQKTESSPSSSFEVLPENPSSPSLEESSSQS